MGNELTEELDWLDAKLRDEMSYIDDAGFTARVVKQLPAQRRAPRFTRAVILLSAAIVASVLAFIFAGSSVVDAAAFLAAVPPRILFVLAVGITFCLTVAGGAFAFARSRDARR